MNLTVPVGTQFFTPEQLQQIVAEVLPKLPDGKTGAAVATLDANGVKAAVEVEKQTGAGTWTIQAAYEHDWNGQNNIGGSVMYSW